MDMTRDAEIPSTSSKVEAALHWRGGIPAPEWLAMQPGESLYLVLPNVTLLELRKTLPPLLGGTTQPVAVPAGGHSQRSVCLQEEVRDSDTGSLVITDHRVEFVGAERMRRWPFAKLTDITHDEAVAETWLLTATHKRISGFRCLAADAAQARFALSVALAESRGTREALASSLRETPAPLPARVDARTSRGRRALGVAKLVYLGKSGAKPVWRISQGLAAGFMTLALVGAVIPGSSETPAASETGASVQHLVKVQPTGATPKATTDAQALTDAKVAAARQDAAKRAAQQAAAQRAARQATAKAAAQRAAAARRVAAQAAAKRVAAQRAADAAAQARADAAAQAASAPSTSEDCTPAYPDFCIPLEPGDAYNCGDFDEKDFTARADDPYRLDRDGDGVACES